MHPFHKSKQSAAILKHGIIDAYAPPFIGKTGSTSDDNRVAIVDGYAGPGRYTDGGEGSGAMLLRHANTSANMPRNVELHLVEQETETLESLRAVVENEGSDVAAEVYDGDISGLLPEVLAKCEGIPLFVYLDPCGLVIPFDEVASIWQRPSGLGIPGTEVLINFSAVSLRRIAGHLTSDTPVAATLARMDAVCGGDWWRDVWTTQLPDKEAAEEAVVHEYAKRLTERAKHAGYWVVDVRARADLKPLYYLVFVSRHIDGLSLFGEAASLGLSRWREATAEAEAEATLFADGSWKDHFKASEKQLQELWVDTIAKNLQAVLAKGKPFSVVEKYEEVYGDLVGVARAMHLRAAIKNVYSAGLTPTSPVGVKNLLTLRIVPT